jgi:signal transduction histidine kinase
VKEAAVILSVTDTGCGIPEDKQRDIFKRFFKVDSFVQGAGLGLPICRTITERLGGTVSFVSRFGEGSRFAVTLPLDGES